MENKMETTKYDLGFRVYGLRFGASGDLESRPIMEISP